MQTYDVFNIAGGADGTEQTLNVMAELALNAQLAPITRGWAVRILNASMAQTPVQFGKAVWRWVRNHMRLLDEPIELIQNPEYLLSLLKGGHTVIDGDCDDAATLCAALILALGIPVRFVAVRLAGADNYMHVFCEMQANGQWWAVDPTVVNIPDADFERLVVEV